ncbi:MAG: LacI family transcriptional regulator [Chloroflexota bacterium]|nr:MAG: LacI family transcriptional regulator [Chloroflexota bacterium]
MRDVAERAGVSVTSVSHVINQTRLVSDDLRERVLTAMNELGYQPNALARSLRRKETYTIGVIMTNSADPFFAEVTRGVEDACFEQGYNIILCNSDSDLDKELFYTNELIKKRVDGILFLAAGGKSTQHIRTMQQRKTPLVVVDRYIPDLAVDTVLIDNARGGWLATHHLIELGHRRIGCISGPSDLTLSAERVTGYRRSLQEAGIQVDESLIVKGNFQYETGYQAAQQFLAQPIPPTAIFACNDLMAIGVINAAVKQGWQVPDRLSVIGFDDIRMAAYINPLLTTVAQPKYEMGSIATTMLLERIHNQEMAPRQKLLDTQLVVRESTAPPCVV